MDYSIQMLLTSTLLELVSFLGLSLASRDLQFPAHRLIVLLMHYTLDLK